MGIPKSEREWQERTRVYLKDRVTGAKITHRDLAAHMKKIGFDETRASIANKLGRGTFSATFFLAALTVLGCDTIRIKEI